MFVLHEQLQKDAVVVGQFKLSLVLLHRDANYPWLILVPKRASVREIHHLAEEDQYQLIRESSHLAEVMTSVFAPDKMNVAAIGNMVPQLHIHHVARFKNDKAWPRAIWGHSEPIDYSDEALTKRLNRLHASLVGEGFEALAAVDNNSESNSFTP